ncbi:MAG TPA: indolepyruvate ferredoxin oxidoreductase subunit alpha [Candidatus Bathyarchaeia archaeon]|nr:indolepyruvate ferredoxin oxidoreductase subunit alpha [Candidatus Bathyarchaeia archaeon]
MILKEYLLGNAAIARGILEAGAGVVTGYPGTPASEIVESVAPFAKKYDIHVEWSVNEKAALEVAIGASWTGTRAVAVMKHVGLNVAADPFMTLAYTGVRGGLVVIAADDPFCHSSQNEQDSRRYAQFAGIPCLDPADPQEAKDMCVYAFELSEKLELPVLLRPTTRVSHARADVEVGQIEEERSNPEFVKNPARWVMLPVHARPRHTELLKKQDRIKTAFADAPWNRLVLRGDLGIIASGISGLYAEEAIKQLEIDISILRIGTFPPPDELCSEFLRHVTKVMVIEELEPVLEEYVERLARAQNPDLEIIGKRSGHIPREGELDSLTVRNAIAEMFDLQVEEVLSLKEAEELLPPRPPALCPGCSHRATYYAMRKAFGKDAIFPSDIGCYTLAVPMGTIDTCLCMGASITVASGIRFGGEERDICCSIGDSTFLHAGLTGLLNAAYNKARITVAILDNSTTAMTGHQPHPGTGFTVSGEKTKAVSIGALAKALGADFVETVDPYDVDATIEAFKRAKEFQGLSVVIAKQTCVTNARRAGVRRRPFTVNDENCDGCRKCVMFGCPAIEFDGESARINSLCSGCGVCAQICTRDAIEVVE